MSDRATHTSPILVVRHARLATMTGPQAAVGDAPLGLIEDGALVAEGGVIRWLGEDAAVAQQGHGGGAPGELLTSGLTSTLTSLLSAPDALVIDAGGRLVTPGYVEPHSHLLFAGDRASEFAQRMAGATYLTIAQQGGGILATVGATRAASDAHLLASARERLLRLAAAGVTTVEVKTGYGLSVADELRLLRLIVALGAEGGAGSPCDVIPTLLGLHAVPPGLDRAAWVRAVAEELTPEAARLGARGCDAFCEQGAFTLAECRTALEAGARAGLVPHLHADQLSAGQGAELAADLGCASADHLERTTEGGVAALARAGTVATLLPLAAWFLREPHPAQAAPYLAAGVPVALGGNLNPGSQRLESHSMLLAAGCLVAGLTPAQALWSCTAAAARALRLADRGRLATGLRADLVLHSVKDAAHLAYHAGVSHVRAVIRGGALVLDRRGEAELLCD